MSNKDFIQRFIFEKAPVRGEYVHLHESFQTIVNQHNYPEPIRKLLGEALCVASLLTAIIKFKGKLTVQFQGKGKLKMLLAQCDSDFHLRGLVKWEGTLDYSELMESFKDGVLVIMLDSGSVQNRYQGIVSWTGNSLAESIEGYFRDSEQLATRLWLQVNKTSAVGYLLQIIPSNSGNIEQNPQTPAWDEISTKTAAMMNEELLGLSYENMLAKLYPGDPIRVFHSSPVEFQCTCSRKRSADAIIILGREEVDAELEDNQAIVVTCDFCNKEYVFDRDDIDKIFASKDGPDSDKVIH